MSDQATLFDLEALAPGDFVPMAAPKHAEFPRLCSIHPVGVGWSCRYGVCERERVIRERRAAGEVIGARLRTFAEGARIRDIYWLTEYTLLAHKKGDCALLRLEVAGPGRQEAPGDERVAYDHDARYEVVS